MHRPYMAITGATGIGKSFLLNDLRKAVGQGKVLIVDPLASQRNDVVSDDANGREPSIVMIDHVHLLSGTSGGTTYWQWYCRFNTQSLVLADMTLSDLERSLSDFAYLGEPDHLHLTAPYRGEEITADLNGVHSRMHINDILCRITAPSRENRSGLAV